MKLAVIGLGANLGQMATALKMAVTQIAMLPHSRLVAVSSLYASAPIEVNQSQPDYLNAAAAIETGLAPHEILAHLHRIEALARRQRGLWHAARTLDLDLITCGAEIVQSPTLTLPHPRAHLRAFVLLPMAEIVPDGVIPGQGRVIDLLPTVANQQIRRIGAL